MVSKSRSNSSTEGGNTISPSDCRKQISPAKKWCFTLNNYSDSDISSISSKFDTYCDVWFYGKEVGENGTPHLQGYCEFKKKCRPKSKIDNEKIHWEKAKGSKTDNIEYCSKDGPLTGKGFPKPIKTIEPDKEWMKNIIEIVNNEPDPRTIYWFWEPDGGAGKSAFTKWLIVNKGALVLSGKAADMKYGILKYKEKNGDAPDIVIFDVPRSNQDYISYTGMEEIKNGFFFSPKYESDMVVFNSPHIIVFANNLPEYSKLSADRWKVIDI